MLRSLSWGQEIQYLETPAFSLKIQSRLLYDRETQEDFIVVTPPDVDSIDWCLEAGYAYEECYPPPTEEEQEKEKIINEAQKEQ